MGVVAQPLVCLLALWARAGACCAHVEHTHTLHTPAGSSRLYEDPDVDEYGGMDDVGYMRRSITNQQDFVMSQLDFLRVSSAP